MMKKLSIIVVLLLILISCQTTPIIINERPKIELKDNNKIVDDYKEFAKWKVEIIAYIDELINQITHKVPYKDLRKKK